MTARLQGLKGPSGADENRGVGARSEGIRLFGRYAIATALPIVLLGFGLGQMYRSQMDHRALEQAVSEASALASAGIEPRLEGKPVAPPLSASERAGLVATTGPLLDSNSVLRLRLRDISGHVVFDAADRTGGLLPEPGVDDEAVEAASGRVVRRLTHLNSDEVDARGHVGARAVEVYLPLHVGGASRKILGVLEIYLPYSPIARSLAASEALMLLLIVIGLTVLWALLGLITWSVTRRLRRTAAANEYLALHDNLTGLPNRSLFGDRAGHALGAARRAGTSVGGRGRRPRPLQGSERHARASQRRRVPQARRDDAGGTASGRATPSRGSAATSSGSCSREPTRREPATFSNVYNGRSRSKSSSAGFRSAPRRASGSRSGRRDAGELDELLQCADLAMYAAKESRAGIVEYSTELEHFSPARLALVSQLRRAIASDELVLHYQPKLELRTGRIVGVEALVRWQHPTRGLLPPSEFLDLAESTGLIDPLTDWVIDRALGQLAEWHARSLPLTVAVNVSARNLRDDALPDRVFERLAGAPRGRTPLPRDRDHRDRGNRRTRPAQPRSLERLRPRRCARLARRLRAGLHVARAARAACRSPS